MKVLREIEPIWVTGVGILLLAVDTHAAPYLYSILLVALFLFWPFRYLMHLRSQPQNVGFQLAWYAPSPITLPILLLTAMIGLGIWTSPIRILTLAAAGDVLFGITLAVALFHWTPTKTSPARIGYLIVGLGVGLASIAPFMTAWKTQNRVFTSPIYAILERFSQNALETIHANILAGALALCIPLVLSLFGTVRQSQLGVAPISPQRKRVIQIVLAGILLLITLFLTLTQSRGAYLATGCGLLALMTTRQPRLGLAVIAAGGLITFFLWFGLPREIQMTLFEGDGTLGGWPGRLDIWQNSLAVMQDFPFTGIGIGTFQMVLPRLYPLRVSTVDYPHAHNIYLQVGVDLGIPGLISFLAIPLLLGALLIGLTQKRDNATAQRNSWLASGTLGALVVLCVHGLVDTVIWANKLTFFSWLLFALAVALTNDSAHAEAPSTTSMFDATPPFP